MPQTNQGKTPLTKAIQTYHAYTETAFHIDRCARAPTSAWLLPAALCGHLLKGVTLRVGSPDRLHVQGTPRLP